MVKAHHPAQSVEKYFILFFVRTSAGYKYIYALRVVLQYPIRSESADDLHHICSPRSRDDAHNSPDSRACRMILAWAAKAKS